jgi:hypothetical protein
MSLTITLGQFFLSIRRKEKSEGITPHWGNFSMSKKKLEDKPEIKRGLPPSRM